MCNWALFLRIWHRATGAGEIPSCRKVLSPRLGAHIGDRRGFAIRNKILIMFFG